MLVIVVSGCSNCGTTDWSKGAGQDRNVSTVNRYNLIGCKHWEVFTFHKLGVVEHILCQEEASIPLMTPSVALKKVLRDAQGDCAIWQPGYWGAPAFRIDDVHRSVLMSPVAESLVCPGGILARTLTTHIFYRPVFSGDLSHGRLLTP